MNRSGFLQLDDISLSFGERTLFAGVQLTISPGSRIALSGANGSGKSTLMKIAAGIMEYDTGRIIRPGDTRIAYLPQSGLVHRGNSLKDEAMSAFGELPAMAREAERIAEELERGEGDTQGLLDRARFIRETLEHAGWNRREGRIERVLTGLGFRRDEFAKDAAAFSGGRQMRIALAKILIRSPDILFLDEPTNYLDLEAREWLGDFVKRYAGGIMLVSHDRAFLDRTCTEVAEIRMAALKVFKGSFSSFESARESEAAALMERWRRQQEEIARIESFISRFRYKASKAAQVQSRVKMLEKMERIEIPPAMKRIRFSFPEAPRGAKTPLRAQGLSRRYGTKTVFSHLDAEFPRGSRTAVAGVNGAGKSTLLRILCGRDKEFEGELFTGTGTKTGYFSQDRNETLHPESGPESTVIENASMGTDTDETALRGLLGAFLFTGDDIFKKTKVLSGGERSRLELLKILLQPVNLLILDEPTNHLDIVSKDILLDALIGFGGTLIIVSHDRYFLERIADRVLEIEDGRARLYLGGYAFYRERKEAGIEPSAGPADTPGPGAGVTAGGPGASKASHERRKQRRSALRSLKNQEERLTARLEEKEKEAASVRLLLEQPENYSNPDKARTLSAQLARLEERIEQISEAWEEAAAALEKAESE